MHIRIKQILGLHTYKMKKGNGVFSETVRMSAFQPVNVLPVKGRSWVTNGVNNINYKIYKDAYDDSPTNSSIINSIVNYIYADGLYNASTLNTVDISQYISEEDVLLICQDYKIYGGYAVQVIWDSNDSDKRPLRIQYMPVYKLGVNYDWEDEEVNGYWYSFNWADRYTYAPQLYPKFTGEYKGNNLEILLVRRPTSETYFPVPDYLSGIPWAQVEGNLSHAAKSFFDNSMSALTVINYNNGMISDEEEREKAAKSVRDSYTGPNGSGKVIVSFNEDPTTGVTVDQLSQPELNQQTTFYSEESERKLVTAHSVRGMSILFAEGGTGFSSNADEISIAQKILYRNLINPMRKVIIKGLNQIFNVIDPVIKLDFKDFEKEENLEVNE